MLKRVWKLGLCLVALSLSLTCWAFGAQYTVEQVTTVTMPSAVLDMEGFSDELAKYYYFEDGTRTYGYMDSTGDVVIPAIYTAA